MRRSAGLISISMLSSISGDTNTAVNEVWRRLPESNGLLRTRRCTPISVRSQPKAYSPLMCTVAPLMPATSPSDRLDDSGVEAVLVGPAQVHAQQHVGPVLGLGAAGAGLDVQVGVVRVHLAAEHAAELQLLEDLAQTLDFVGNVVDGALVVFLDRHVQQVAGVGQAAGQVVQGFHHLRQLGALAAEVLGVFGVVPDVGVFELAVYFDQAIMLLIVVKDTPEWSGCARRGP